MLNRNYQVNKQGKKKEQSLEVIMEEEKEIQMWLDSLWMKLPLSIQRIVWATVDKVFITSSRCFKTNAGEFGLKIPPFSWASFLYY